MLEATLRWKKIPGSLTDSATSALAAKWKTTSKRFFFTSDWNAERSPRSNWKKVAPVGTASRNPVERSSTTVTECPRRSNSAQQTEPTYPAPPVTRTFIIRWLPFELYKDFGCVEDIYCRRKLVIGKFVIG